MIYNNCSNNFTYIIKYKCWSLRYKISISRIPKFSFSTPGRQLTKHVHTHYTHTLGCTHFLKPSNPVHSGAWVCKVSAITWLSTSCDARWFGDRGGRVSYFHLDLSQHRQNAEKLGEKKSISWMVLLLYFYITKAYHIHPFINNTIYMVFSWWCRFLFQYL